MSSADPFLWKAGDYGGACGLARVGGYMGAFFRLKLRVSDLFSPFLGYMGL